jgi:hypothetical protein
MPSPFPGMDPYLEQETIWHDFHERFLPAAAAFLAAQVLPRYIVLIDEHIYLHDQGSRVTTTFSISTIPTHPSTATTTPGRSRSSPNLDRLSQNKRRLEHAHACGTLLVETQE